MRKVRCDTPASLQSMDIYTQFVLESQVRVVEKLSALRAQ
jgi:hypothetical protein